MNLTFNSVKFSGSCLHGSSNDGRIIEVGSCRSCRLRYKRNSIVFPFFLIVFVVILLSAFNRSVLAHGVHSEEAGPNKVHFHYDDESPVKQAFITVRDSTGKELGSGKTDDQGNFDYTAFSNADEIEVNDPMGHHTTYSVRSKNDSGHSHSHSGHDHDHEALDHEVHDHDQVHNTTSSSMEPSKSENKTTIVIIVLAVLVLIAIGFSRGNRTKPEADETSNKSDS